MKRYAALIAALISVLLLTSACAKPKNPEVQNTILRKSEGEVVHRTYAKGQPVPSGVGYNTLDPATGRVDAWTPAQPDNPDQLMRIFFAATPDGHWVVARNRETGYLIDRTGSGIYAFDRSRYELVAAAATTLVFEERMALAKGNTIFYDRFGPGSDTGGTGKLTVLDKDLKPQATMELPIATSSTRPRPALLSPDGTQLALLVGGQLYLVNLKTGEHTTYQSDSGIGRMEADRDGKSFRLLPDYGTDAPPFRYTWEGKPLPYLTGDVAPTGKQTLTREWVQGFTPALVVRDAATGAPQLRLVGAEQCYGYAIAGSHWTADGSAILFGARDGFYMAGIDGSLRQPPAFNTKDEWHEPFPSPTDPKLFVDRVKTQGTNAWRFEIVEESGKKVQSATFEGNLGSLWPVGPLWHPSGTFVQISWYNRGGTGAPCGDYRIPLAPVVQKPPFPEQLSLTVAGTGDCLNVRTEPSVSAQVVACLKDGTKVTVAPDANQVAQIWGDQRQWARVKTADGKAGWASVEEQYLHFSQ